MAEISQRAVDTAFVIDVLKAQGVISDKKPRKERVNWERILAQEYVRAAFPNDPSWFRKEVGGIPNVPNAAAYARTRRWVDVIVRPANQIVLIEAKMKPDPKALSQLDLYDRLFSETPEFKRYKDDPRRLILVTAMQDSTVSAMAPSYGIEHVVFRPSNFEEWFRVAFRIPEGQAIEPMITGR